MNTCPCCDHTMIRQVQRHRVYWFCRSCWQEMPLLEQPNLCLISPTLKQRLSLGVRRPFVTV